ncbi:MAG: hypothetical protein HKN33_08545 [Pyrinomonadaceae bacterium]|nr:hypothetical protein [Pyrinomonadaceae bacterium]
MNLIPRRFLPIIFICFWCVATPALYAFEGPDNHLDGFNWLVDGGKWSDGATMQEFEWGLDRMSVKSRSYAVSEGEHRLVSEGVWFWHPGKKVIKGHFFAVEMPFSFIESEAEFDGSRLIHRLSTYSGDKKPVEYVEVIEEASGGSYSWKLFSGRTPIGKAMMTADFRKK